MQSVINGLTFKSKSQTIQISILGNTTFNKKEIIVPSEYQQE